MLGCCPLGMEKSKNRNLSQFLNCEHLEPFPDVFRNVLVQKGSMRY